MKASLSGWASGLAFFCFLANHANVVSCKFMPRSPRPFLQEEYNHYGAHQHAKRQATGSQCAPPGAQTIQAPKSNIWAGLNEQEAAEVTAWLHEQLSLNLTAAARAGDWDNAILLVELMIPNKTDALPYLDNNAPPPERYAHVILDIRASEEPYYQSLLVGPLPVGSGNTRYEPLDFPFTKKSGGRIRALDDISASIAAYRLLYTITASIADITQELWNGTVEGKESDVAQIVSQYPLGQDDGITQWFQFLGQPTNGFEADTLLPLGLYFSLNITGRDPNLWKLQGWYYNGVFYETTEDFKSAFAAPGFEKLAPNVAGQWTSTDQTGEVSALDDLAPPMTVAPSGSRYSVDEQEKYVKWMDFEFYIAFSRDTGVRLFDIKYRGERIIYELGLEEALAHYAGNDPVLSGIAYLDSWLRLPRARDISEHHLLQRRDPPDTHQQHLPVRDHRRLPHPAPQRLPVRQRDQERLLHAPQYMHGGKLRLHVFVQLLHGRQRARRSARLGLHPKRVLGAQRRLRAPDPRRPLRRDARPRAQLQAGPRRRGDRQHAHNDHPRPDDRRVPVGEGQAAQHDEAAARHGIQRGPGQAELGAQRRDAVHGRQPGREEPLRRAARLPHRALVRRRPPDGREQHEPGQRGQLGDARPVRHEAQGYGAAVGGRVQRAGRARPAGRLQRLLRRRGSRAGGPRGLV
ncbi:Copper amine oxidase [Macrophomina phaseolina MS6]|uniref:Amine oxidase n=1 Tax=Macrophomina phaseolina (strain MS6) TaxID=1126212 RepID=K2RHS0_MACPH|nr:Copper amine oxidase [Macrophomina phaseolina MS6]